MSAAVAVDALIASTSLSAPDHLRLPISLTSASNRGASLRAVLEDRPLPRRPRRTPSATGSTRTRATSGTKMLLSMRTSGAMATGARTARR
ncbi:unnamed protein product [Urochloa humidicola]